MSASEMMKLVEAQNVWDGPAQSSAMTLLAWYHSEKTDYASVSFGRIARWAGIERRYVLRLMEQLQLEKEACVNLGPDPEHGGRNRWKLTIGRAIAKARWEAGAAADVHCSELPRRRRRRRGPVTGVIPGSPAPRSNSPSEAVENSAAPPPGDPGITTLVILGSPPGDPGITPPGDPGITTARDKVPESTQVPKRTATPADAVAAPSTLGFQLIGEALGGPADKAAKHATDAARAENRDRLKRIVRWLLDHPAKAPKYNGGAAVASESDLYAAAKARCREHRIPGYKEGDVLVNLCRSEWHLFGVRGFINVPRLRDTRRARRRGRNS